MPRKLLRQIRRAIEGDDHMKPRVYDAGSTHLVVQDGFRNRRVEVTNLRKTALSAEADLMVSLIERWELVQGFDGGEDSTGRAHISLMPVADTVQRAADMAEQTMQMIRERGWEVTLPHPDEVYGTEEDDA